VDDNQQYPVDFLYRCTPYEPHKPFGNITLQVAYGSAFAHFPGQTNHDMLIPPGYTSVSVEEICQSQFEDLELDIPGGDGEKDTQGCSSWYHIVAQTLHYNPPDGGINPSYRSPAVATIITS
jgi:hypothetical protein